MAAFMPGSAGEVNTAANGFDPMAVLTDFDYGAVSYRADGRRVRTYKIQAVVKNIEIMPGISYEAWTYNGRVPGPTLRATEGDLMRVEFTNGTPHPHTMHFHTVHPANMDGVYEPVPKGGSFVYEFDAAPFGVHPYHCHIMPLASHISRGLYGAIVIDPRGGRPPAGQEMVMIMAGNDLDFDNQNDAYNVNFIPFYYDRHPIKIKKDELVRIYLLNEGNAPIQVQGLSVATTINGRVARGPLPPQVKEVAPRQRALLREVQDTWKEETNGWSMEATVRTTRGEVYTNQVAWQ
jgi:FtsP/CotA-like multicopper oxidase with cupredoxin domain